MSDVIDDTPDEEMENSWFEETFKHIQDNKTLRESGGYNAIPFGIPSLDRHIRIVRGWQYIITASSGIGKTQLAKFLFISQAYKFVKEHPDLGIKLKIKWFALEESRLEFMLTLICKYLRDKYNITVGVMDLTSMTEGALSDDVMQKVEEAREYFKELEECLEVLDNTSNPFGRTD